MAQNPAAAWEAYARSHKEPARQFNLWDDEDSKKASSGEGPRRKAVEEVACRLLERNCNIIDENGDLLTLNCVTFEPTVKERVAIPVAAFLQAIADLNDESLRPPPTTSPLPDLCERLFQWENEASGWWLLQAASFRDLLDSSLFRPHASSEKPMCSIQFPLAVPNAKRLSEIDIGISTNKGTVLSLAECKNGRVLDDTSFDDLDDYHAKGGRMYAHRKNGRILFKFSRAVAKGVRAKLAFAGRCMLQAAAYAVVAETAWPLLSNHS